MPPRTAEGLARVRAAKTEHGLYSATAQQLRAMVTELRRLAREVVEKI
jgi:hypothetical protein